MLGDRRKVSRLLKAERRRAAERRTENLNPRIAEPRIKKVVGIKDDERRIQFRRYSDRIK